MWANTQAWRIWRPDPLRILAVVLGLALFGLAGAARAEDPDNRGGTTSATAAFTTSTGSATSLRVSVPSSLASLAATGTASATAGAATSSAATPNATISASASATAEPAPEPKPPLGQRLSKFGRSVFELGRDLAFKEWPSPLFEANFWNTTLAGVRVLLPLGLALVWLWCWIVRRGHGSVPEDLVRHLAYAFCVLGFLVYYGGFNPNVRHPGFYQPRAYYHVYLGEKYRAELGDGALVECTLAAEKALGKTQTHGQRHVYARADAETQVLASSVPSAQDPAPCEARFSPARWQAFRNDVNWFASALTPEVWGLVQHSRAEPTSPLYRWIVSPLVSAPASETYFRVLALLEPALHALALVGVTAAFGPLAAALVAVAWGCQPFMPFDAGAGLLGNAWLVLWILGACALRRNRGLAGGVLLGFAACLEPVSALGLLPIVLAEVSRRRRGRPSRPRHAALTLAATLVIAGGTSAAVARYTDYASEVATRTSLPTLSDVGLSSLLSNRGVNRYRFQRAEGLPDPSGEWSRTRSRAMADVAAVEWTALALALGALCYLGWRKRSLAVAATLGLCWSALYTQPLGHCSGLIALGLVAATRAELAVPLLTAVSGAAIVGNQTLFTDDRAALLTGLSWLTALLLTGAQLFGARVLGAGRIRTKPREQLHSDDNLATPSGDVSVTEPSS